AAVGPATASAARRAGWEVLGIAAVDAASLGESLKDSITDKKVWLPQSAQTDTKLAAALKQARAKVARPPPYEPEAQIAGLAAVLNSTEIDVVTFFSGSAVRAFADASPQWRGRAVCVGSSTAAVARDTGFADVVVAVEPSDEAVAQAMLAAVAPT